MKKLLIVIGIVAVLAGLGTSLSATSLDDRANCGTSAVVKCGTFNQTQVNNAFKNKAIKAVYSQYGIQQNLSAAKNGVLYPDGTIKIGKKVVATGAQTIGREHRSGSVKVKIGGETFYKHSAKVAFPKAT